MGQTINKLRMVFDKQGLDGLLVSNFYNILYLTGFKTLTKDEREAWVLVTINNTYIFSDGRYLNKVKSLKLKVKTYNSKLKIKLITLEKRLIAHLQEIIREEKIKAMGFEGEDLRVNELRQLEEKLPAVKFITTNKLILKQRELKDRQEIEKLKKACQIADQCLKKIVKTIKVGMTEKEIAFKIEFWLKSKNYDMAFDPIVAIDSNSSIPHYETKTGQGKVKNNSIILIDFGVKYQDYCSDISRMIFVDSPKTEVVNIYRQLLTAQKKTIVKLTKTNNLNKIDFYCRKLIVDYRLPNYPHPTGHGVGLEVHECPKVSQLSTDSLQPGQVFTIEPGVYFPGKWGMRIEDTVLVKENGVEILTKFSKNPLIIND